VTIKIQTDFSHGHDPRVWEKVSDGSYDFFANTGGTMGMDAHGGKNPGIFPGGGDHLMRIFQADANVNDETDPDLSGLMDDCTLIGVIFGHIQMGMGIG
jgi:hypothetical protein